MRKVWWERDGQTGVLFASAPCSIGPGTLCRLANALYRELSSTGGVPKFTILLITYDEAGSPLPKETRSERPLWRLPRRSRLSSSPAR